MFTEATRYALQLHLDQIGYIADYNDDPEALHDALENDYKDKLLIYPESDPRWNAAVLSHAPFLVCQ